MAQPRSRVNHDINATCEIKIKYYTKNILIKKFPFWIMPAVIM
jgi:hypothetical protein